MDSEFGRHVFGWNLSPAGLNRSQSAEAIEALPRRRTRNPSNGFRNLPEPTGNHPFHLNLAQIIGQGAIQEIRDSGKLIFHAIGDTGQKTHGAAAQEANAHHMGLQAVVDNISDRPRFMYLLGDVVYFNGAREDYEEQFYEPYKNYPAPIFAIAGNHDGAVSREESALQGFMENFCSIEPRHSEFAGESPRTTMVQPNCYWTLGTPFGRIIGLYSNVPGRLDQHSRRQEEWLIEELRHTSRDEFAVVAVHHPPYSRDTSHGGYESIGESLDRAFRASGRIADLVLCGHVHNYQRFERNMSEFGSDRSLNYVIAGAGGFAGYDSLHQVDTSDVLPEGVTAASFVDSLPGFLRLTMTGTQIRGEYFVVQRPPQHIHAEAELRDEFRISR